MTEKKTLSGGGSADRIEISDSKTIAQAESYNNGDLFSAILKNIQISSVRLRDVSLIHAFLRWTALIWGGK